MSTLTNRPSLGASRTGHSGGGRPLALAAAVAGPTAAAIGLVVCMSLALTGWFLADAGSHGATTDALRVGADAWLLGHGSHLVLSGVPLGITPLTVTMVLVLIAFRSGRWAAAQAAPDDGRGVAMAVATFTGGYVVVAVLACLLASQAGATPVLGRVVLGAVVVAGLGGGTGVVAGSGHARAWLRRAPGWVVEVVVGAVAGVLWLVAAGGVLVGVSMLRSFNEAANVLSGLDLGVGDAVTYSLVVGLVAPNVALLGSAYLLGPGFAFGAGTTVSPTAVSLGAVPAFPVLAALPDEGPTPGWLLGVLAVPVLAAASGAASAVRRHPPVPHDLAAMRGAAAGFLAGILVTLLVALAGGPLGDGRMADVGAPVAEVLVFATGLMAVGGLLGGFVGNAWRRRPPRRSRDHGAEPTVEVLR